MELRPFYLAHRELVLIPVEHLSERGVSEELAAVLRADRGLGDGFIALLDRAMSSYWERAAWLYERAPDSWFPPRLQNLCIALDAQSTRPYHQPFHRSSWLLYASDFDPDASNLEYATHQLLHAERLSTSRDMAMAVICGMSYWLVRSDAEVEAFVAACRRSSRPDAAVFVRLAEAMPWVRTLFHDPLRPPAPEARSGLRKVKEAGLWVPEALQAELHALVPALRADASAVMEAYLATAAKAPATDPAVAFASSPADHVCEWLERASPPVLVTDEHETVLWDPEEPRRVGALRRRLEGIGGRVAQSLREDLEVVGERSAAFLASLRDPERLPRPGEGVEQDGGIYVHATRPLMVYSLAQPGLRPLLEPAPPYHRMLVGARTIHEWGHLAEEAGWVAVPEARRDEHEHAQAELRAAVQALVDEAPAPFRRAVEQEAQAAGREPGALVCALVLERMPDFLANLLARRYLPPCELEAYVRANVYTHFGEEERPLHLLARHVYEYQYLSLSRIDDPLRYFLRSTWWSDFFVDTGLVPLPHLMAILEATARLRACYEVDEDAFVTPPRPAEHSIAAPDGR
ncbi:hypothetical protein [Paraliomyxa miuraensis]|uniref:hypothetical protein n=1 Tax=Paraliomyxa miuraensis TaxID=376150 RepID=UPI0022509F22|nr:hypothetical protein [Paraliomyxa miuraensis]MCX4239547.1 hypothetical protein [Paraliomyxa miuraensis]